MESIGTFKVLVCRHGKLLSRVRVRVETIDGSANEGEDYQAFNEVFTFEPHETEKEVIIDHFVETLNSLPFINFSRLE